MPAFKVPQIPFNALHLALIIASGSPHTKQQHTSPLVPFIGDSSLADNREEYTDSSYQDRRHRGPVALLGSRGGDGILPGPFCEAQGNALQGS